ncbi:ATP-binding protein [Streptomyces sp. NPDC054838]
METMSVEVAIGDATTSVADARQSALALLARLVPPMAEEPAEAVVLVVSELVTNALRHAGGTCTVDLTAHTGSIEIAVHDASPHPPLLRTPDLNGGAGGFGWPMINRLAHTTRITHRPTGGKTVSALLTR